MVATEFSQVSSERWSETLWETAEKRPETMSEKCGQFVGKNNWYVFVSKLLSDNCCYGSSGSFLALFLAFFPADRRPPFGQAVIGPSSRR